MGLKLNRSGRKLLHAIERENKDLLQVLMKDRLNEQAKEVYAIAKG